MMPTLLPTSRSVKPNTLSIMMILPPSVLFTLPTAPEHLLVQNDSLDTLIILEVYCSDKTNTSPIHDSPCTLFRTQPSYIDQLWLKLSLLQNYHDCFQFLFCTTKARMSLILTTANTHSGKLLLQYYRLMLLYIQSLVLRVRIITWSCRTRLERRPRNYLTKHTGR